MRCERNYKVEARDRLNATVPVEEAAQGTGFAEDIVDAYRATNLLHPIWERPRVEAISASNGADTFIQQSARFALGDPSRFGTYLRPLASRLKSVTEQETTRDRPPRLGVTFASYVARLEEVINAEASPDPEVRWIAGVASLAKRQRAYGPKARLEKWAANRGLPFRGAPLPT